MIRRYKMFVTAFKKKKVQFPLRAQKLLLNLEKALA